MTLEVKHALITGSSRGIGRGIALALAERGVRVAVHYYQNEAAAEGTLAAVREWGSGSITVQAEVTLEQRDVAFDSQPKAFLVAVREAVSLMEDGGRFFAITYATGSRTGGLRPWIGMGSAKAALESMVRYFAVSLDMFCFLDGDGYFVPLNAAWEPECEFDQSLPDPFDR